MGGRKFGNNGNGYSEGHMAYMGNDYNDMQFRNTLKDGEFFEKWHYQDQRLWKLEHWFMEMAKRMNFSDMEMQVNQWMNSHDSMQAMRGMRSSWMDNKNRHGQFGGNFNFGNFGNNSFSKFGSYGSGNNYDNFNNYGSNWKNVQIAPPSGCRDHPSRPQFANRFNSFSK